jgi:hypothetical protein
MMITYNAKTADGGRYTMTVTEATAPNGKPAVRVTCSCATHPSGADAAIVATPSGIAFPKGRIHGHVTMANHPAAGPMAARMGKAWAAAPTGASC